LRVLMASDFYPPFIGGTERQVQLLSKELVRRGHAVNVATVWHKGLPYRQDDRGVIVHRLKGLATRVPWFSSDANRRYHPPFPDPRICWGLRGLIGRLQPDVVHAHGWITYSCAAALLGKSAPLLVSVRDYGYTCAVRTLLRDGQICDGPAPMKCLAHATRRYGAPKALMAVSGVFGGRVLLARGVRAAQGISIFVQGTVQRDLLANRQARPQPIQVTIPDVVDASLPDLTADDPLVEDYVNRLPSQPFILFVGALQPHKGLAPLLAAYGRLASPPPLTLIGTRWPDTPRRFPPGVTVLYNVPHPAVMAAWERCLFGVAPSVWAEPLGDVLIEAMGAGKAVVATAVGGIVDVVVDGETGLLVPPGDPDALANAMRQLIDDEEQRDRMGRAGKRRAELFSADAIVPRFEALYREVVAEARGGRS
jgi:glycosyltransferase involved in cell wall biosynthesis